MTWGRGSGTAAVLALGLLVAGCSSEDESDKPDSASSATATTSATGSSTPSQSASPTPSVTAATPSVTPSSTPADCPSTAKNKIPDGTWKGPVTMRIKGSRGSAGYADSTGTGTLTAVVSDGEVRSGTWTLTWRSRGQADSGGATATVTLTGRVTGPVKGTAAKPVVTGAWTITGRARVTANGQTFDQPIDESGTDTESMAIASSSCDQVTGTFVPSFQSKETLATFTGTARWTGSRVG